MKFETIKVQVFSLTKAGDGISVGRRITSTPERFFYENRKALLVKTVEALGFNPAWIVTPEGEPRTFPDGYIPEVGKIVKEFVRMLNEAVDTLYDADVRLSSNGHLYVLKKRTCYGEGHIHPLYAKVRGDTFLFPIGYVRVSNVVVDYGVVKVRLNGKTLAAFRAWKLLTLANEYGEALRRGRFSGSFEEFLLSKALPKTAAPSRACA